MAGQRLAAGEVTQGDNIVAVKARSIHVLRAEEETGVDPIDPTGYHTWRITNDPRTTADAPTPIAAHATCFNRLLEAFAYTECVKYFETTSCRI